jgi:hypothetical protein
MEEQKQSVIKSALMPGIYLGIILIIYSLILYLLDIEQQSGWNYLSILWMAGMLFWAMITTRDKTLNGNISYGKAFGVGFWTGLFAAIISAIFTYIFVTEINPNFAQEILTKAEEQMLQQNPEMSDEQLEMALSMTEKFTSPVMLTVWALVMNVFFATVLSLIISIFVKREEHAEISVDNQTEE